MTVSTLDAYTSRREAVHLNIAIRSTGDGTGGSIGATGAIANAFRNNEVYWLDGVSWHNDDAARDSAAFIRQNDWQALRLDSTPDAYLGLGYTLSTLMFSHGGSFLDATPLPPSGLFPLFLGQPQVESPVLSHYVSTNTNTKVYWTTFRFRAFPIARPRQFFPT